MATWVLFVIVAAVGAVGIPVKEGDSIVLLVKVSVPAKVAIVPVVGKVIFVIPVLVKVVVKLPAVMKSAVVDILPPKLIVLVPLFTPVPPNVPAIGSVKSAVPLNERPYILLAVCNCVVVLELPAKLAVIIPALKLPLPSLLTNVYIVFFEVAEAILLSIVEIVE